MPTNSVPEKPEETRDSEHAHATGADLSGARRDSEKDASTPQPGGGTKTHTGTKDGSPEAELGHS